MNKNVCLFSGNKAKENQQNNLKLNMGHHDNATIQLNKLSDL